MFGTGPIKTSTVQGDLTDEIISGSQIPCCRLDVGGSNGSHSPAARRGTGT